MVFECNEDGVRRLQEEDQEEDQRYTETYAEMLLAVDLCHGAECRRRVARCFGFWSDGTAATGGMV